MSAEDWVIGRSDTEAMPWGTQGMATAQLLASADDRHLAVIRAEPGYRGDPHPHPHAEFTYVISGTVVTDGHVLHAGDAAAAPAGSHHDSFEVLTDAVYLSVFRL